MATRPTEELIIDRTLSDVNNLRTKGNYNATDLNRVEKWCKYLMELLSEYGYYVSIVTKTDWEIGLGKDRMFSEITRIKTNIQKLKDAFYVLPTTPEVPSVTDVSINYIKANNIEKILKDMGEQIKLARLRRDLSAELVAERAGISRASLWKVESGNPAVAMGIYAAVLHALNNMDKDLLLVAKDDEFGRQMQDLSLITRKRATRRKN